MEERLGSSNRQLPPPCSPRPRYQDRRHPRNANPGAVAISSDPFSQEGYDVRFGWGPNALKRLGATADTIVLVDVLSFTTAVDIATASGATIFPFAFGDGRAAAYAEEQNAVLAGSRYEDGFSLSPSSVTQIDPGTRLVLPSPNGAELSLLGESLGQTVVAACLRNAATVAKGLMSRGTIAVIAAGERWDDGSLRPAVEDLLGAGAVIASTPAKSRSPEAEVAASAFLAAESHLGETLREAMSGRELIEGGFAADVELAADLNASTTFPLMIQGFFSSP